MFSRNSNIFIQENAFESVVCEKAAILSRPQCVNGCGLRTQTVYSTTKYMGIYKGDEIICGTIVALHGMTKMY